MKATARGKCAGRGAGGRHRRPRPRGGATWLLAVALAAFGAQPAGAISILKAFHGDASDGRFPYPGLVSDGAGNHYGTTYQGGGSDLGTIFKIGTNGSGFTVLHSFTGWPVGGAHPEASLILDGAGNLYGTTWEGGTSNQGTVFTVRTDGTGFAVLHSFTGGAADGSYPWASLILDGSGNLYGTTYYGGSSGAGTVFTVATSGAGFSVLHSFTGSTSDGAHPYASLVLDGSGNLYGTTYQGGASGEGTVFTITTGGSGFSVLHSFAGGTSDGAYPFASLVLDGSGNLYGTTPQGGTSGEGTVFTIPTGGGTPSLLHSFAGGTTDGAYPQATLLLDGSGHLYGTTYSGGASNNGTVFAIGTGGGNFSVLHSFQANSASNGAYPSAPLILDGSGNLYGTTGNGGASSIGTVFTLTTAGMGFSLLHTFAGAAADGSDPRGDALPDGSGNLNGTTREGGTANAGIVFTITTAGTGFAVRHNFRGINTDGTYPQGSLVADGSGDLFGITNHGGEYGYGTVYTVPSGLGVFSLLHSFQWGSATDGAFPSDGLVLDGSGNLYGTSLAGGSANHGTIFTVTTDGTTFSLLHSFTESTTDGGNPTAGLVLDGSGNLYGTTPVGGASDDGTIFKITTGGSGFTLLHSFTGSTTDGGDPQAALVLDGSGNLYGTTSGGGASGEGTVFKIATGGTGFTLLHSFSGGADGAAPQGPLVLDGSGNLYGTTSSGGAAGFGTVFTIKTTGAGFTVLHTFAGWATDGASPVAGLTLDGSGNIYGTTPWGGVNNIGTVFSLPTSGDSAPQELSVSKTGTGAGAVSSAPGGLSCGSACSAWFVASTVVTLSAVADTGSTFSGWSGEGCSGTGTCQVSMDQSRSVTATFTSSSCTVTLSNMTITTTQTFTSCGTLTLGPAFRVASPGNVTAHAALRVTFANGFSVGPGATFHTGIDPSLAP